VGPDVKNWDGGKKSVTVRNSYVFVATAPRPCGSGPQAVRRWGMGCFPAPVATSGAGRALLNGIYKCDALGLTVPMSTRVFRDHNPSNRRNSGKSSGTQSSSPLTVEGIWHDWHVQIYQGAIFSLRSTKQEFPGGGGSHQMISGGERKDGRGGMLRTPQGGRGL